MNETPSVSLDQAVERLGLSRAEIYRRVKDGALTGEKVERRLCFRSAEIDRCAEVLSGERDLLGRRLAHWLTWFGDRVAGCEDGDAEVRDVSERPTAEQVAELGNRILQDAVHQGAGDVHLDPVHSGARLIFGGDARTEIARFEPVLSAPLAAWVAALAEVRDAGDAGLREGLAKMELGPVACQVRVREVPTLLGPHYHLHLFTDYESTSFEALGYTASQSNALRELLQGRSGLFLVASSGTPEDDRHRMLLALELARRGRLAISIERRVQYQAESLIQLELRERAADAADAEFRAVWRAALDMSPDAIVVDEVNSISQTQTVIGGARSGMLVVLRMAADRLPAAVEQIATLGADAPALTRTLVGGVERVMFPRVCPNCRVVRTISSAEVDQLGLDPDLSVGQPAGCARCRDGYAGRRAVYGLWRDGAELARRLAEGGDQLVVASGEQDFEKALRRAVVDGDLAPADAAPLLPRVRSVAE